MQWNICLFSPLLATFLALSPLAAESVPPPSIPSAPSLSMWVWLHDDLKDDRGRERILSFCKRQGIERIFVELQFTGASEARTLAKQHDLKDLIRRAAKAGIAVEALDGHREMSLAICRADTLQRLDQVLAFQKALPKEARFAALHYDIEPYLGDRWKNGDEQGVMRETLDTMAAIRAKVKPESGLAVIYDIPSWYDRHPDTLTIEFAGESKNFHEHIQDLSDAIGIMSYRRNMVGTGSVSDICSAEMAYGAKIGKKVYPSLETGRLPDEPEITFYGAEAETFRAAITELYEAQKEHPAFGGIYLHYYESLQTLLEPAAKK